MHLPFYLVIPSLPLLPSPLGTISLLSVSVESLLLFCKDVHLYHGFRFRMK